MNAKKVKAENQRKGLVYFSESEFKGLLPKE
jgi:hypothetical protein